MAAGPANALDRTRRARRHRRRECHIRAEPQVVDLGTPPGKDRSGGSMHSRRPAVTAALASLSLGCALGCGDLSGITFGGGPPPPPTPLPPQENFTTTGSMLTGRYFHTATLLLDGKVLVAGGWGGSSGMPGASAELYDPSTASRGRSSPTTSGVLRGPGSRRAHSRPGPRVVPLRECHEPRSPHGAWARSGQGRWPGSIC
jgi:hypothetical protein